MQRSNTCAFFVHNLLIFRIEIFVNKNICFSRLIPCSMVSLNLCTVCQGFLSFNWFSFYRNWNFERRLSLSLFYVNSYSLLVSYVFWTLNIIWWTFLGWFSRFCIFDYRANLFVLNFCPFWSYVVIVIDDVILSVDIFSVNNYFEN